MADDFEALLNTVEFAELFQTSQQQRGWTSYPWEHAPRDMWPDLLVQNSRPRLARLSASKAVKRLMWTLTGARTYYKTKHLATPDARGLVHGFLTALAGAEDTTEALAERWRWYRPNTSMLRVGRGSVSVPLPGSKYRAMAYFDGLMNDGALLGHTCDTVVLLLHNGSP